MNRLKAIFTLHFDKVRSIFALMVALAFVLMFAAAFSLPSAAQSITYPASPEVLNLPGYTQYATRAAYRAANPGAAEPPAFNYAWPIVNYVPPQGTFQVYDPSGTEKTVGPYTINLPNDALTFPAWKPSPTTNATYQEPGNPTANSWNVSYLCMLPEAMAAVSALNASGIPATFAGDQSALVAAGGTFVWPADELRRPFGVNARGATFFVCPLYAQMAATGVGSPGGFSATGLGGQAVYTWQPTPPPNPSNVLGPPVRALLSTEFFKQVQTGLFFSWMVDSTTDVGFLLPGNTSGGGLTGAQATSLAHIEAMLTALGKALGIALP